MLSDGGLSGISAMPLGIHSWKSGKVSTIASLGHFNAPSKNNPYTYRFVSLPSQFSIATKARITLFKHPFSFTQFVFCHGFALACACHPARVPMLSSSVKSLELI